MTVVFLIAGMLICSWQAIRSPRLLTAALWLAGVSALVAIGLYWLAAREAAVIELSVSAGLVTILFVFAIATAGEDAMAAPVVVPRWLAWALAVGSVALLAWLAWPLTESSQAVTAVEASFTVVLWQERALDVLVQIGLIFAAVLGVLSLLAETDTTAGLGSQPVQSAHELLREHKNGRVMSRSQAPPEIRELEEEIY
jgi:uncharacterized MnhB-related membrane protein